MKEKINKYHFCTGEMVIISIGLILGVLIFGSILSNTIGNIYTKTNCEKNGWTYVEYSSFFNVYGSCPHKIIKNETKDYCYDKYYKTTYSRDQGYKEIQISSSEYYSDSQPPNSYIDYVCETRTQEIEVWENR